MTFSQFRFLFRPGNSACVSLLGALLLVPVWPAAAASFTGNLERVMSQSLTILQPDGILINVRLPGGATLSGNALAAQRAFGDQVKIECKLIVPVWDQAANLTEMLELQSVEFLRRADAQEMKRAVLSPGWRRPGNLLQPPADQVAATTMSSPAPAPAKPDTKSADYRDMLEKARAVNLERASHLPNFTADEEVSCSTIPPNQPAGQDAPLATVTARSEVTFKGMSESRQQLDAKGKPVPAQNGPPGCMAGGFGAYLRPLFDPQCGTQLTFSKAVGEAGHQSLVYNFSMPGESGCIPPSFYDYQMVYPAHEGTVLIDIPSGIMISVVSHATGLPKAYAIMEIQDTAVWGVIKIEGEEHVLPVSYERMMAIANVGTRRVLARYSNHRHFEAASSIAF